MRTMHKNFSRIILFATLAFLASACGSSKKVQVENLPEWVSKRPVSQAYYYGIGSARKTLDVNQYQQTARQNALADMASEISISISSNSVIHAFESNLNFREDFSSTIRAQAQQDLEGYEVVDTWENETTYWISYRLSKSYHQELKEKRKQDAITRSLDFFSSGIEARENGKIRLALVQMIKALEPIKSYFNEPLPAIINGSEVYLGNEIFKEISNTLSRISFTPTNQSISVKVGQPIHQTELEFKALYNTSTPIEALPLEFEYSEKPLRNNKQNTNAQGLASLSIDIVRSQKSFETFFAKLDLTDILMEASTDPITRRLIHRFRLPEGSLRISLVKPVLHIVSREMSLGQELARGPIEQSVKKKAIEMGYTIDEGNDYDYTIDIEAHTTKKSTTTQFVVMAIEGTISVKSSQGNELCRKELKGIEGRHIDEKRAAEEAFKEAQRKVEITYFREIHEALLQ